VLENLERRQLFDVVVASALNNITSAVGASPTVLDLTSNFSSSTIHGTTVRFNMAYGGTNRNIDIELFDQNDPLTTANFLKYVDSGRYDGTFFHRLVSDFVLQGGGYKFPPNDPPVAVDKFGTVNNEFNTSPRYGGKVNVAGTLAMAKRGGDPNSADSEFFFNLNDNSDNLDNQNGGFTTFASVVGTGSTTTLGQLAGLPGVNLFPSSQTSPFGEVPLANYTTNTSLGSLTQTNFVYVTSARRISPVQFSVSSSSNSVVPTVDASGKLTLAYAPGDASPATITVTATDLSGGTLSRTFNVNFTNAPTLAVSLNNTRLDSPGGNLTANLGTFKAGTNAITATISLRSTGSIDVSNLSVSTTGGFIVTNATNVPTGLAVGDVFNLSITVAPNVYGARSGTLHITAPGASNADITIPLAAVVRLPVTLGTGTGANAVRSVTVTSGSVAHTFSLSGPGTAEFLLDGSDISASSPKGGNVVVSGSAGISVITLTGTSSKSVLSEAAKGKGALIDIGTVTTTGTASLSSLNFKNVNLTGSLTVGTTAATDAILKTLTLGAASNATIFLGQNADSKASATVTVDRVSTSTFTFKYPVAALKVNTWDAGTGVVSVLADAGIKSVAINSDFNGTISASGDVGTLAVKGTLTGGAVSVRNLGNFTADAVRNSFEMTVNGVLAKATINGDFSGGINTIGVGSFTAGSGLNNPTLLASGGVDSNGTVVASGDMGKITFKGNVVGGDISALNTLFSFSANSISQTRVFAGPKVANNALFPATANDFNNPSRIGSVTLAGKNVSNAFSASAICARTMGTLKLGTVDLSVTGTNGIVGVTIANLQMVARGNDGSLTKINRTNLLYSSAPITFGQTTGVIVKLLTVS
jgi:cyclophilin family peptidyl-prolyl cis-trans isomerase